MYSSEGSIRSSRTIRFRLTSIEMYLGVTRKKNGTRKQHTYQFRVKIVRAAICEIWGAFFSFSISLSTIIYDQFSWKNQEGTFLLSLVYSSRCSARYNIMKRVWVGRRIVRQNPPQFLLTVISTFYPRRIFTGVSRSMRGTKRPSVRFTLKIKFALSSLIRKILRFLFISLLDITFSSSSRSLLLEERKKEKSEALWSILRLFRYR